VLNLIDNAIKYAADGQRIEVAVRSEGKQLAIAVRDFGPGVEPDEHHRIFERFYRAHADLPEDYGGMGVGLFLSREIVRLHHGRMWFQSVDGVGSRFFIALPRIP
jgi:signal transduction histidine kinase